jgi:hydrogenase nickel incorporation protein HypB
MCTTCGCGSDDVLVEGTVLGHEHGHSHAHALDGVHRHDDTAPAPAQTAEPSGVRTVSIEQDILAKNDTFAARNRSALREKGVFAVNLVSSPGSGKTTLLEKTIGALAGGMEVGVIEGDQQTSHDADRIRASGARAIQINTGRGCHLDAHMVGHAIERLAPGRGSVLMIENVGNLVCPAAFDLGEAHKVVVLSITEGEDKPLKYPDMFRRASLMLLNKIDLLPHLDFDLERCIGYAQRVNPDIRIVRVSAKTGEGMGEWFEWIQQGIEGARAQRADAVASPGLRRAERGAPDAVPRGWVA